MAHTAGRCIFTGLFSFILCSCASWDSASSHRAGVCNTLNSKLIFSGSTSNVRQAEMESAEEPLQQHTYDKNHCDQ